MKQNRLYIYLLATLPAWGAVAVIPALSLFTAFELQKSGAAASSSSASTLFTFFAFSWVGWIVLAAGLVHQDLKQLTRQGAHMSMFPDGMWYFFFPFVYFFVRNKHLDKLNQGGALEPWLLTFVWGAAYSFYLILIQVATLEAVLGFWKVVGITLAAVLAISLIYAFLERLFPFLKGGLNRNF